MNTIKTAILIGAGNVAWHLGIALQKANIQILGLYNRTKEHGEYLAQKLNIPFFEHIQQIPTNADIYLLASSDSAIAAISEQLPENNGIVVHHSGSMPLDTIATKHHRRGVFYCLQTFKKETPIDFSKIPILLQASEKDDFNVLKNLAQKLSSNIRPSSDTERSILHVAAVFACNFSNYLYSVAYQLTKNNNIDFELLVPLIQKTAQQLTDNDNPLLKQTGPAIRKDLPVIEKHLQMLENDPKKQALYRYLTDCILNSFQS